MILFTVAFQDEEIMVEKTDGGLRVVERWKVDGSSDELVEEVHGDPLAVFVERLGRTLHLPPTVESKLFNALKRMSPPIMGRAMYEGNTLNVVMVGKDGSRVTLRVAFSLS